MFADLPLAANLALFLAGAAVVWRAGTRLVRYADALQAITGFGQAMIGMLLLGGISGLPDTAVSLTAAYRGDSALAANGLIGGVAVNMAVLAAADSARPGETMTSRVMTSTPLLQGVLLIGMLGVVGAATLASGATALAGIGAWAWAILGLYVVSLSLVRRTERRRPWRPREPAPHPPPRADGPRGKGGLRPLVARSAAAGAAILVAGYVLAGNGEALAGKTGLGSSFFGVAALALATSLPEISIAFSAARLGRYELAISDVFGSGLYCLALFFALDAVYAGPPVLSEAGPFVTFAALLGVVVTALFLAGVVKRNDRRIGRMGTDSLAVLGTYLGGLALLYGMRP